VVGHVNVDLGAAPAVHCHFSGGCFLIWILAVSLGLAATTVPLQTVDGKHLSALVERSPQSTKGVVLVHMDGRTSADWSAMAARLAKSQMTAIAPDLRGHGKSKTDTPTLGDADYAAMVQDLEASVAWLRKNGAKEVSCVGASLGANLCLALAARDPSIVNLVLLSPGLNYHGVKATMDGYGDRPVLFVASSGDTYGAKTVGILEQKAIGQHHSEIYEGAAQGTKMLSAEASLEGTIVSWLLGTYELASGELVMPKVDAGSTQAIETSGQKLDVHR
jgi:pimeloyl-ACP methyl ester carboxylesterase